MIDAAKLLQLFEACKKTSLTNGSLLLGTVFYKIHVIIEISGNANFILKPDILCLKISEKEKFFLNFADF